MITNMKKLISTVVIVFAGVGVASIAQAAKLRDPGPSQWGCELSDDKLMQGITAGLIGRGWIIKSNDGAGNLVAQVIVRGKHTLVVDIKYDSTSFDINYKDSDRLKYKEKSDGTATIHRNANSWMENIQNDITAQLSALCTM